MLNHRFLLSPFFPQCFISFFHYNQCLFLIKAVDYIHVIHIYFYKQPIYLTGTFLNHLNTFLRDLIKKKKCAKIIFKRYCYISISLKIMGFLFVNTCRSSFKIKFKRFLQNFTAAFKSKLYSMLQTLSLTCLILFHVTK